MKIHDNPSNSTLNLAQQEAASFKDGACLVIAGAGSGKTKTLVHRVVNLMNSGVEPGQILLLTFTRKAASEMLRRAQSLLDLGESSLKSAHVAGGTFHSFAAGLLRRYGTVLGYQQSFSIIDREDAEDIISLVRTQNQICLGDKYFPKKNTIANLFSRGFNNGTDLEKTLKDEYPHLVAYSEDLEKLQPLFTEYKRNHMLMDYDDLLANLKLLLENHPHLKRQLSLNYRYIMVDEYQDTNLVQADIVRLLASEHGNILVVGDDCQSIYSFRGARFKNIIDFPKLFKNTKLIILEQNYRSTQPILAFTNQIITSAEEKYSKTLFSDRSSDLKPQYIELEGLDDQAQFITTKISQLLQQGVALNKIGVLFRAGFHSNELEVELSSAKIPFVKYGGLRFVENAHIKDLLSFLRIIHNQFDPLAWHRILLLLDGIGEKAAERLLYSIVKERAGVNALKADNPHLKGAKLEELKHLSKLLDDCELIINSPADVLELIIKFYTPIMKSKFDDYHKREPDIESLRKIIQRYDTISAFLADVMLELPSDDREDQGKLVLSTIHSAKGLEWKVVFVISLSETYFPPKYIGFKHEAIEEERRLFYVACTRAEDQLYLIYPNLVNPLPCRFIEEIYNLSELCEVQDLSFGQMKLS